MDSLPYGGRGQRRSGLPPSPIPIFPPFAPPAVLPPPSRALFPNITRRISPLLLARTTSAACVGTHMSRIPTVFPLAKERESEGTYHPHLTGGTPDTYTTYTRVCEVENDRHVHSRARPFAALSRGPPFKTARAMDRRISALFCSRHTRERFRVPPKRDGINRPIRLGMLIRNLDRSRLPENSFGAIMSHRHLR